MPRFFVEVNEPIFFKAFSSCYAAGETSERVVELILTLLLFFNVDDMETAQNMLENDVLMMAMMLLKGFSCYGAYFDICRWYVQI